MRTIVLAAWFLQAAVSFAQAPAGDADTVKSLLAEVHQLRLELQSMSANSQRIQIVLFTLQTQDAAVARATQRLDAIRNRCRDEDSNRQSMAADIERLERSLSTASSAPTDVPGGMPAEQIREAQNRLVQLKTLAERQAAEVGSCQAMESEATSALRDEQARLAETQERLARLDKALAQLGAAK